MKMLFLGQKRAFGGVLVTPDATKRTTERPEMATNRAKKTTDRASKTTKDDRERKNTEPRNSRMAETLIALRVADFFLRHRLTLKKSPEAGLLRMIIVE
jgi:hypothetical protein